MEILSNNLTLNVYNNDKSFYKTIRKASPPIVFPYFYETDSVTGILTRIGGRNIDTKNTIMISNYSGEIEITNTQDKSLRNYYKNGVLEFYITKKINKETQKVEKSTLDDFIIISQSSLSFINSINDIRAKYGDYFAEKDLEDE